MTTTDFQFDCLLDARLAPHAASPRPAWLWAVDGSRILWANPTGADIFGATNPAALAHTQFDAIHPARKEVQRLAASLASGQRGRLERLRAFGARVGGLLTCACSRIAITTNGTTLDGILIISAERAGPDLSLAENASRLLAGNTSPVAAYDSEGKLLHAAPAADAVNDLTALGASALIAQAMASGMASGDIAAGTLSLARIGAGADTILLATLDKPAPKPVVETKTETSKPETPVQAALAAAASGRGPLRFVWQIDEAGRFTLESPEFIRLIGPQTAALFARPWPEITQRLALDHSGVLTRALAAHETFSGITVPWPVDGSSETLPIELSGLPMFGRDREFRGYRGFGICRDAARLDALAIAREFLPAAVAPAYAPATPAAAHEIQALTPVNEAALKSEPAPKTEPALKPENIVHFPASAPPSPVLPTADAKPPAAASAQDNTPTPPTLSPVEKLAFRELARRLGDGLRQSAAGNALAAMHAETTAQTETPAARAAEPAAPLPVPASRREPIAAERPRSETPILDRVPFGILVYRLNELLYANKAFLDWTGYATLHELMQAGGLDTLFIDQSDKTSAQNGTPLTISTQNGTHVPVEGRLFSSTWNDESALVLMVNITQPQPVTVTAATTPVPAMPPSTELRDAQAELTRAQTHTRELEAILNTATDGVIVLDRDGKVLSANHAAQALFGCDEKDFPAFGDLFAPDSRRPALDYLDRLADAGSAALINEGREVIGRVRQRGGGLIPLFMTLGRVGGDGTKFCAVFRDITAWKKTEEELLIAKRKAETSSTAKSEFLAKISHEMRSPLNTIIGFSEVMIGERFGPIGNERYRDYLKDIHASGEHLIALLNDLLDLSRIETGKLDLTFASVNLNDLTQQCVAILQAQANRGRVIIRTAFAPSLPAVVADARAVRQIVLNLISSSLKMTGAGGQVIVSTTTTDSGDIALRVRDSGTGLSPQELAQALNPFQEFSTTPRWGASGTGLGLPITKALAEANHASFRITSAADTGTLIEIVFPATRVLAE